MAAQQAPYFTTRQTEPRRDITAQENVVLKWVSLKELIFIFVACCVAAMLMRTRDNVDFNIVLQDTVNIQKYSNEKFPTRGEKLPPIVTDLESDGQTDIVLILPGKLLKLYSTEPRPSNLGPQRYSHSSRNVSLASYFDDGVKILAVGTGFLEPYQSMLQIRRQVIVVLGSDWTVVCLNTKLRPLWTKRITDKPYRIIGEASILVLANNSSTSQKDFGSIFVSGRIGFGTTANEDSFTRKRRGAKEIYEEQMIRSLGHYSTYAIAGKSGTLLWKHEPGDFEIQPAYEYTSSFVHLKLALHKYMNHAGEVSWHQYSSSIANVLPHSWYEDSDTRMEVARFSKDRRKTDKPKIADHISKVSDLAVSHLAGYAFGGLRPHSSQEHVQDPNVLVIHSMKGLEVLDLKIGRPLFSLPLSPAHAIHKDINGDGIVDHVHAIVNPNQEDELVKTGQDLKDIDCFGLALPMSQGSKPIFKHSICKATHWTESFLATEEWLPNLNKFGRKKVNHAVTEPFTPTVIESISHQHPLKLASLTRNASYQLPVGLMYDSVFVLSSGRVTSIGPADQFNWQVDTGSDWDKATSVLYSDHKEASSKNVYKFVSESFTPTNVPFSLKAFEKQDHVLIIGWNKATILDGYDGATMVEFNIPCPPIMKALIADFTNDGINDILIVCADRVLGFSPSYQSGFLHKTALSLFVGFVIVLLAVYTRQRTGFLMPVKKQAQD